MDESFQYKNRTIKILEENIGYFIILEGEDIFKDNTKYSDLTTSQIFKHLRGKSDCAQNLQSQLGKQLQCIWLQKGNTYKALTNQCKKV